MPQEDFRVLERVGQGAQGTVYRAIHIPTGNIVAMKRIPVSGLTEAEKTAALQEVRVLSTLKQDPCPYVMGYTESFIDAKEKELCLILEWSSEGTLQDTIDNHNAKWKEANCKQHVMEQPPMRGFGGEMPLGTVGGGNPPSSSSFRSPPAATPTTSTTSDAIPPPLLTEGEVWRAFLSVAAALFHVHCQNILHRDVKMANVFLHSSRTTSPTTNSSNTSTSQQPANRRKLMVDRVQLGDFGVSTILADRSNALTMVGTPYFFSPELCMGRPYSGKSDMWSLGVMLFAMLFNRLPFEASNYGALILRIVRQEGGDVVTALQKQLAGSGMTMYSPILYKLCTWCLQKKDSSRPTAYDVLCHPACLQQCLDTGLELPPAVLQNQAAMASLTRAHRVRVPTHVHENSSTAAQEVLKAIQQQQQQPQKIAASTASAMPSALHHNQQAPVASFKVSSPTVRSPVGPEPKSANTRLGSTGLVPDTPAGERPLPMFNKRGGGGTGGGSSISKVRLLRGKTVPNPEQRASTASRHHPPTTVGVAPVLSTAKRAEGHARTMHTGPAANPPKSVAKVSTPSAGGGGIKSPLVCYDGVSLPQGQASFSGLRLVSNEERQRQQEKQRARDAEAVRALGRDVDDDESEGSDCDDPIERHGGTLPTPGRDAYHQQDRSGLLSAMAAAMHPAPLRPRHKSPSPPPQSIPTQHQQVSSASQRNKQQHNISTAPVAKGMPVTQHDVNQHLTTTNPVTAPTRVVSVRCAGTISDLRAPTASAGDGGDQLDDRKADDEEIDTLYSSAGAVNMQLDELRDMMLGAGHADYIEWCEAAAREREMLIHEQWDDEGHRLDSTNGIQAAPFVVYEPGAVPPEVFLGGADGLGSGSVTWRVVDGNHDVNDATIMRASESHPSLFASPHPSPSEQPNNTTFKSSGNGSTVVIQRTERSWNGEGNPRIPSLNIPAHGGPPSYLPHLSSTTNTTANPTPACRTPMPTGRYPHHARQHSNISVFSTPGRQRGPLYTGRSSAPLDTARSQVCGHALDSVEEIAGMLLGVSNEAEEVAGGPVALAEILEVLTRGGGGWDDEEDRGGDGIQSHLSDSRASLSSTSTGVGGKHSSNNQLASTVNISDLMMAQRRGQTASPSSHGSISEGGTGAKSQDAVVELLQSKGIVDPRKQCLLLHLCLRFLFLEGQQRKLIRDMANPEAIKAAQIEP